MTEIRQPDEQFIRDITVQQHRLYGLILSMLPDPDQARDVLQETNVVIWKKFGDFTPGTNFGAWAAKIAYYQVASHRKTCGRDRHIFNDELISVLHNETETAPSEATNKDDRIQALDTCMERLSDIDRKLLQQRYTKGNTVSDLAEQIGKSPSATRVLLFRLRHLLLECVQGKLTHLKEE